MPGLSEITDMHFKMKLYRHCHNHIPCNLMEMTNTTYTKCALRQMNVVWLCLLLSIYPHTVVLHLYVVTVCNATTHWNYTCSWWHIHYILVLDFYPIDCIAIFHNDQLHVAVCSQNLSCIVSMASCDHFRTYGPAHIKINSSDR